MNFPLGYTRVARLRFGLSCLRLPLLFLCLWLAACAEIPVYESVSDPAYQPQLRAGMNGLRYIDGQLFYLYVPEAVLREPGGKSVLVAIHGYAGRKESYAGEQRVKRSASRWAGLAEREGWIVMAPQFDAGRFSDAYQQLGLEASPRADQRLHELLELSARLLPGINTERVRMFGFSGGAQFVHRYAMLHPRRVERAVIGAAGWYTLPDAELPFPIGIRSDSLPRDLGFEPVEFESVPLLLLVGDRDIDAGAFRRRLSRDGVDYSLDELQGEGRLQRARNWIAALREQSAAANVKLEELPDTGHRITEPMRERAAGFLAE